MSEALHLRVITPVRVVVDTAVDAITVPGALGALGILPGHAPLLSSLGIGVLSYWVGTREHQVAVVKGFLEVASSGVTVLADHAELPEEIDLEAAYRAKNEGEEAMRVVADEAQLLAREQVESATVRIAVATGR